VEWGGVEQEWLPKPVGRLAVSVPFYATDPAPLKLAISLTAGHVHAAAYVTEDIW